jgi:hypothetical protein
VEEDEDEQETINGGLPYKATMCTRWNAGGDEFGDQEEGFQAGANETASGALGTAGTAGGAAGQGVCRGRGFWDRAASAGTNPGSEGSRVAVGLG